MFPTPQWHDLWAAVLFYIHFALFVGISVYSFVQASHLESPSQPGQSIEWAWIRYGAVTFGGMAATAIGLTILTMLAMYKMPETMLHVCFISNVVLMGAMSIFNFMGGIILGGIIFAVIAVIGLVFYFVFRSRIPFSGIILQTVIDGLKAYPSMLGITGGSVFLSLVYLIYFAATLASLGAIHEYDRNNNNVTWMSIYVVFSLFWTSQVLTNTVQTTISGVYATFYFLHGTGQVIFSPVASSLRRAMTYSFGSICFGSLIVAIIQLIRYLLSIANDRESIGGAIVDCILGIIEGLVRYFNYYAYTQIAIYGKPYVQAAKDTWSLVKARGVDAIVNDDLIGTCTSIASLVIAVISGGVAFLIALIPYGQPLTNAIVTGVILGIIALVIPYVAFVILTSGATTTFVCLAEDPSSLQRTKPALYEAIMQKYSMINL